MIPANQTLGAMATNGDDVNAKWENYFWLSVQSFVTIGYGTLQPVTLSVQPLLGCFPST
jgi:hypothetical protein